MRLVTYLPASSADIAYKVAHAMRNAERLIAYARSLHVELILRSEIVAAKLASVCVCVGPNHHFSLYSVMTITAG